MMSNSGSLKLLKFLEVNKPMSMSWVYYEVPQQYCFPETCWENVIDYIFFFTYPNKQNYCWSYDCIFVQWPNICKLYPTLQFRFVVMGNMFCTELRIHRRFDLKGSSLGRSADKVEIDENTTLKDLDLSYRFYLEPSWRDALLM